MTHPRPLSKAWSQGSSPGLSASTGSSAVPIPSQLPFCKKTCAGPSVLLSALHAFSPSGFVIEVLSYVTDEETEVLRS